MATANGPRFPHQDLLRGKGSTQVGEGGGHADRAYSSLVRSIATCELPPGSVFNERDEAARLGMSRTPLRQALHRLALEGLVETIPKKGVVVSLLDPHDIRDNTIVREALEVESLRRTIIEGREVDLERLRQLLRDMRASVTADDAAAFLRADEEFHIVLAASAGNDRALAEIHRSWIHVNRVRYLKFQDRASLDAALREHRSMLRAVQRGDVEAAEAAVRAHMERSRARLEELTRVLPGAFVAASLTHSD